MSISDKIFKAIKDFNMLESTKNVLVGVSGGSDSVCLLHFLNNAKKVLDIKIFVIHIDHCIRGEEAERDKKFVENFCMSLGIPFYSKKVNVPEISLREKLGEEECGRRERYKLFNEFSKKLNSKIATAHTLSDSIETIFLNMVRGCSINGLCGIPAVRGNIIRPLIYLSKDEVELYCKKHGLKYVYDSSNSCKEYNRNKIRLEVIPALKSINFSLEKCFERFIGSISKDKEYLDFVCEKEYQKTLVPNEKNQYKVETIENLHPAVRGRVIYKILENLSSKDGLEQRHINLISKIISEGKNGCITLKNNIQICIKDGILFKKYAKNERNNIINWEYELKGINFLTPLAITFIIEVVNRESFDILKLKKNSKIVGMLDYDKIPNGSVFRNRREKDVFSPAKRGITKSIKNLFNELKILPADRYKIPMLATGSQIIWIYGVGESEGFRVKEDTKNLALILERENTDVRKH